MTLNIQARLNAMRSGDLQTRLNAMRNAGSLELPTPQSAESTSGLDLPSPATRTYRDGTTRQRQDRGALLRTVPKPTTDFSPGKLALGGIRKGVTTAGRGISSTAAWLEGALFAPVEALTGFDDLQELHGIFYKLNEQTKKEAENVEKQYAENREKGGTAAKVAESVIAGTTAAVPQAITAFLSAGSSVLGQAGLEATAIAAQQSPTLLNTLRGAIAGMANNPNYWTSFLQTAGNSYEEAKEDGASDAKASLYALSNGLFNAAIEVGGGIETLPNDLKGGKATFKRWLQGAAEEGNEEIWQGIVERGLQNLTYGKKNPVASVTDENAVINPLTSLKEFGMGAAVGGILGGGQIGLDSAINARRGLDLPTVQSTQEAQSLDLPTVNAEPETTTNSQTFGILEDVGRDVQATEETSAPLRETLPYKAQNYLDKAERAFLRRVGDSLSVPSTAQRETLKPFVQQMSDEYLRSGNVSQETINNLFEQAYKQGIIIDSEFYDQYKDVKDLLRTTPVSLGEDYQADIPDYSDFRRSAFGTLRISNSGTPVDIFYEDLRARAPELFPSRITNPADQLQRMYEVGKSIARTETDLAGFYGEQAEDFKQWAKNDFENAVNNSIAELRTVKRYADEKRAKKPEITAETVTTAFNNIRNARKTSDKAKAKNLMTDYDNAQVDRLLKGEIELSDLDPDRANVKGIREVYEASKEYEEYARTIKEFNKQRKANLLDEADQYLTTANDWKDKKLGLLYSRETQERNIRDIVKDEALAEQIVDRYFQPVHDSQAESTRFKNQYRNRVRDLKLSRDVAEGNTVSEAHAVQLLGEATDNIRVLNEDKKAGELRDGKNAQEWEAVIRELWEQNPNLDRAKIENAVDTFRTIYDELFDRMNEVRVRNGYEPVGYRQGYFPHFQPGETESVIASFAKALGIDTDVQTLPTTINGLTHTFRPGITWFGNAQERFGFNTAYDAVEGFDKYIEGVSDVIHQTDNIQRLRALAQQIRYRTGDEGIRKQMDEIRGNTSLDEETKSEKMDNLKESGRYSLGKFVVELEEYTNNLANKKSQADRQMEHDANRGIYKLMNWLQGRVASNMVTVNPASWLTNFIPLTQGWATLNTNNLLRGMEQTIKAYKTDDGMVARSSFLTNRRGSDPIVKTWAQEASAKLSTPMEIIDQFTADTLVRARYLQNLQEGLSEDAAIKEADKWAAGIMADRSKGATPTIFNRTNPLTKLFTQFQLEVNNEFSNLFKDVPNELKKKGIKALTVGLLKFFVGAWLYNEVYEYLIGRRAAFDPFGLLNDTVGDLTGYELPNLIEGAQGLANGKGADVFRTDRTGTFQAVANLAGSAADELPFVGGVLGGGRVPLMNAIPILENLEKAAFNDQWSEKKRLSTAAKELSAPLTYLALPFGGGQIKKIYQGLNAVAKGGSYSVDSQGRDILQYPVYNDTPGQIAGNAARAVLFGKSSLPGAREWVESGFDSFSAKETAVYQGMNDAGVSDRDAIALLRELEGVQKTDEESANTIKRHIIMNSGLTGNGKSVAYYGLIASEKERALMDELADVADMGIATQMLSNIKDSSKSKGKYDAVYRARMPELAKRKTYRAIFGNDDDPTLNKLSTKGVGIDDWLSYKVQTADLTADKDSDGKTVSGSLKAKEMAIIDAMQLNDDAKDALYLATGHTESTLKDAPWHKSPLSKLALPGLSRVNLELPSLKLPDLKLPGM